MNEVAYQIVTHVTTSFNAITPFSFQYIDKTNMSQNNPPYKNQIQYTLISIHDLLHYNNKQFQ